MKKLAIMALAVFTLTGFAQVEKKDDMSNSLKERMTKRANTSPEDRAKIETKQMALKLDLSDDQQTQVEGALLEHYSKESPNTKLDKKARKKMTDEQRQEMKINRLDGAIALKEKMKTILNDEQYTKYSSMLENRGKRMRQMRQQ